MELKFPTNIQILLNLYKVKEGTLVSIADRVGFPHSNGKIYTIKENLVKWGVLVPTNKTENIRKGLGEKKARIYRVNHEAIDQLFCGELETSIIYDRIVGGNISIMFPRIKKKGILEDNGHV